MKIRTRPLPAALFVALGVALSGCSEKPPQPRAAAPVLTAPAGSAPVALAALPDFTHLVDQVGPAVVTVTAMGRAGRPPQGDASMPPEQLEFFRRLLPRPLDDRILRGLGSGDS